MADDIDRANDVAQETIDRIIAKAPKFDAPSLPECLECGEDIPIQRQAFGGRNLCVDCQTVLEKRGRQ
ncbi:TraR/DksA C4-type zinc finger protein [Psychrobacter sp. 72-O-c]|uniref:TraR/DksA C4-type zinc finger protein n=1 Tax=Psychrobacter sp. 72-O-c TaxID=2774125 RepID=UPI00191AA1BA|nr:TraR/DksA C4-type zinc finger protein [Psychrobacter sp. 72-O-c]